MYKNNIKKKLNDGEFVTGCIVHEQCIDYVEILGILGVDALFIDCEHGSLSPKDCLPLILAAETRGILPLVRVPDKNEKTILRYLEVGAMGLILPEVSSAEEMKEIVQYAKYNPDGMRGMASMRTADFGLACPKEEYRRIANIETLLIPMIESIEGANNCKEIMNVPGVSAVLVGTNDLSQSMGIPGQSKSPEVMAELYKILEEGQRAGIPVAYAGGAKEDISALINAGLSMFFTGTYGLFAGSVKEFLEHVKKWRVNAKLHCNII